MAVPLPLSSPVMLVVSVMAGVVVAVATVPAKPLADTTETEVTVPPPPPPATAVCTNAVVANLVELSPVVGVGAVGLLIKLAIRLPLMVIAWLPLAEMLNELASKFIPSQALVLRL